MKHIQLALLASVVATPLLAQDTREMDAHVHGVSTLELAVEGSVVEMHLRAPGMDIVGFEYAARTDADKDAVAAAIRVMLLPENVVTLPDAAACRLTEALARLHSCDRDHEVSEDHDHGEEATHAEGQDHTHGVHAEDAHHGHGEGAAHSEFHASYTFDCAHPEELTTVGFPFFDNFENAQEIAAQFVTHAGAGAADIGRDAPELTLD